MGPQLPHGAPTLQGWPATGMIPPCRWTSHARPPSAARLSGNLGRVFAQDGCVRPGVPGPALNGRPRYPRSCGGSIWYVTTATTSSAQIDGEPRVAVGTEIAHAPGAAPPA